MVRERAHRVAKSTHFLDLLKSRNLLGRGLTVVVCLAYYGFIYLVAFQKEWMSSTPFGGVTSLSVILGFSVILITVLLTGLYVWRANQKFDSINERILKDEGHS